MGDDGVAFSNHRVRRIGDNEIDRILVVLPIDLKDRFEIAHLLHARLRLQMFQGFGGLPIARFGQFLRRKYSSRLHPGTAARLSRSTGDGASAGGERAWISGVFPGFEGAAPVFAVDALPFSMSDRETRVISVSCSGPLAVGACKETISHLSRARCKSADKSAAIARASRRLGGEYWLGNVINRAAVSALSQAKLIHFQGDFMVRLGQAERGGRPGVPRREARRRNRSAAAHQTKRAAFRPPFRVFEPGWRGLRSPSRPCRHRRRPSASRALPSSACRRSSLRW